MGHQDHTSDPNSPEGVDLEIAEIETGPSSNCEPKSGLAVHSEAVLTPEEKRAEKKFILKADLIILPLIATVYFLAALDRSDVGNAAISGMTRDLHMTSGELSNCVAFFFIGFMLFQLPGVLFIRMLTPPIQLGCALMAWGTATTLMTEARNWQTIAGLRVVVGAFEAFVQGAPLYLTFWYKPHELATRGAIFASTQSVAGSMNGLISFAILETMDGRMGRAAWRWLFLIEGVISVGMGAIMIFVLPPTPEKVKRWFSKPEKEIAVRRTREAFNAPNAKISGKQLLAALKDPKIWFFCLLNGCTSLSTTAWSQFMPIILYNADHTPKEAQYLTIPVYAAAGVTTIAVGYLSDRYRKRGIFLIGCYAVATVGWVLLIATRNPNVNYAGTFLVGMGSMPTVILQLAWLNVNIIGYTKKGGALAVSNMTGHVCAIASSFGFRDGPDYFTGKGLSLAAVIIGSFLSAIFMAYLERLNKVKLANKDTVEAAEQRSKGAEELWDDHPDFMYEK